MFSLIQSAVKQSIAVFHMSRASVIVIKYNLDSYFYILQDLDLIVPVAVKVDDKNKKRVKKSSSGSRSKPKTTHRGDADDPPEDWPGLSFSGCFFFW